jgi:hypothetical protein
MAPPPDRPPGYTEGMEKMALFLFICGMGSFVIATYLMTRGSRSGSSL